MAIELRDIVGQEHAVAQLQRALAGERMPHAMLFAGPAGVGRRTTALALARTLLCSGRGAEEGPALFGEEELPKDGFIQACGACDDCRMMEAGAHPDFQFVYKELARFHEDASVRSRVMQDLGIGVIRQFLIDPANRAANRGRGKVFVVREAELMSTAAQNALLKTLEEPPPRVTILLLCEKPDELLPTTLSRCAMVRFGYLPREFVAGKLAEAGIERAEADFWAAFTQGSVGRSLRLAREGMYEVKRDLLDRIAGLPAAGDADLGEHLVKTMDKLATAAVAAAKKADGANLSKNLASRQAVGAILELLASAFRDAMSVRTGADMPPINADQAPAVEALAERFRPEQIAGVLEALSEYERLLWRNVNPKTVWDNVVITCASAAPLRT